MSTALVNPTHPDLKAIRDQYVIALDSSEKIRVKYNGKFADMSAEETEQWSKWLDEADRLEKAANLMERELKARAWAAEPASSLKLAGTGKGVLDEAEKIAANAQVKSYWKSYFRGATPSQLSQDAMKALAGQEGDLGGFLLMPQQLVAQILAPVKDIVFVRRLATVIPLEKAESLGIPTIDTDVGDPTWTSEIATGNEDTTAMFGKRQLVPHPLARLIKISNKLLRQAMLDPEALVIDRLAYRLGRVMENAYLNGTGVDQPLGVFTASSNGISTGRDTTCASSTAVAGDDFISAKHNLKPQYWPRAQWVLHRLVLAAVRKLKDTAGNYIWQPGIAGFVAQGTTLASGNPSTLLDCPYNVSELAPSTFTTGLYMAALGDWSFYWIADALDFQVQRLLELYAATNQTGFIVRAESDGMPTFEEAFVRVKLA